MPSTPSSTSRVSVSYGAARFATASSSSTVQRSMTVIATICWARTSSGLRGMRVVSIAPSCIRRVTIAHSRRSPRYFGKMMPLLGAPTWWPARPTRWSPRATLVGLSTWMTRSTAPMSIPSSRLEVATSAGSRPSLRASSISTRCSRAMLPWWARTSSSPASSLRRCASRSDSRRLLVKTIVLRWLRMSSRMRGWIDGQMLERRSPPAGRAAGLVLGRQDLAERRHVVDRDDDLEVERLAGAGVDDLDLAIGAGAAEEPGDRVERPLRRRQADPLGRAAIASGAAAAACRVPPPGPQRLEAFQAQGEVGAALGAGDRVDLVDDDVLDPAQDLAGRAGQHQVERFRGRDQDVRRVPGDLAAILRRACRRSGWRPRSAAARGPAGSTRARSRSAARAGSARCRRSAP